MTETTLSDRQLDGFACIRCGSEKHAQVPVGFGQRGQLFECSRHHRVVTVDRQGGYAARCTVVVDGGEELCDITFGGFETRTAARAAIVHEETPGAAGTATGGKTETNQQEETAMTSVSDTTPIPEEFQAHRPAWATQADDSSVSETGPVVMWSHDLVADRFFNAAAFREDTLTGAGVVVEGQPELLVTIDRNDQISFIDPAHAIETAAKLTHAARQFGQLLNPDAAAAPAHEPPPRHLADLDENTMPYDEYIAEAKRRAAAYDCGVPGCDRTGHYANEDVEEWIHWVEHIRAGRLEVDVAVTSERKLEVTPHLLVEDSLYDENALLALAAELRSYATVIQKQATAALELHAAALKRAQS